MANPQTKLYCVGAKLKDFVYVKGPRHGLECIVETDMVIGIFTRWPFFDLMFKLVSSIAGIYCIMLVTLKQRRTALYIQHQHDRFSFGLGGLDLEAMVDVIF